MGVGAIYIACIGQCKIERISVNSFRYQQFENNQRRSPKQKQFGVNLLVRRLVGRSAGPLGKPLNN